MINSKTYRLRRRLVAGLVTGLLLFAIPVLAAEGTSSSGGIAIRSLQKAASVNTAGIDSAVQKAFDGQGTIDRIDENAVVIDDIGLKLLSPGVGQAFHKGRYVGYKTDASGVVIEIQPLTRPAAARPQFQ
ncbi:MAG: hypothetical protein GXP53_01095 [Deltaproteobacteria bacterium]|nr:hypothetical protein [Deltaproteobacteria bacterium]